MTKPWDQYMYFVKLAGESRLAKWLLHALRGADTPNLAVQGGSCTYCGGDSARPKKIRIRARRALQQRASEAEHGQAGGATVHRLFQGGQTG